MSIYFFVVIIALVCLLGFFNEKVTKLTYEISLMLFSTVIGIVILVATSLIQGSDILEKAQMLDIEDFLLEGVLCFMLFAGSCHMKLSDFKAQARQITVLAFVCTLLGAIFYGLLFYGASLLHCRAHRSDRRNKYSQQIRFAEKHLLFDRGRIAL